MKKKWLKIILGVCLALLILYAGYLRWNNYVLAKDTIASLEWVVPLSDDYSKQDDYIRGLKKDLAPHNLQPIVKDNDEEDAFYGKLCGVKNSQGKIIIPPQYESLRIEAEQGYILAVNYSTDKCHYYKLDGTDFVKGNFQDASIFENGYACVEKKGMHYVIDTTGKEILKIKCESLSSFDSVRGIFQFEETGGNKSEILGIYTGLWGMIDINGNIVLEPKYDIIERASENRVLVYYTNADGYQVQAYLDNNFQPISKKSYEEATTFYQGSAVVKDSKGWHIINENEEIIADVPMCENINAFSEGVAVAESRKELKCFDTKGQLLLSIPMRTGDLEYEMRYFKEGMIVFRGKNGKLGYMDKSGTVIVNPIFDTAWEVENGQAYVEIGNKAGLIRVP